MLPWLLLLGFAWASEPSVFEAGNLDNPSPYGLTPAEKRIYQNSKAIESIRKELFQLQERLKQLGEQVEGLKSVVEGLDRRINALERGKGPRIEGELATLRRDLNSSIQLQQENFAKIQRVMEQMGTIVDQINRSYVSKGELQAALNSLQAKKLSGAQLFAKGKEAYRRKNYEEAKRFFEGAIAKHYKPAASNFYIGESCYYQKDYRCAIAHYKQSAALYSKASYMPTLLLHTAISLERLGKREEAQRFYRSLIDLYPNSKAAQIAKRNLKRAH
ncbi:MAG: tetratricopeptide repeat protein [Epsilonproteobacteria bacterium]|nr:tetratricopeptide repeat protein [Campylobacterota bacterium]